MLLGSNHPTHDWSWKRSIKMTMNIWMNIWTAPLPHFLRIFLVVPSVLRYHSWNSSIRNVSHPTELIDRDPHLPIKYYFRSSDLHLHRLVTGSHANALWLTHQLNLYVCRDTPPSSTMYIIIEFPQTSSTSENHPRWLVVRSGERQQILASETPETNNIYYITFTCFMGAPRLLTIHTGGSDFNLAALTHCAVCMDQDCHVRLHLWRGLSNCQGGQLGKNVPLQYPDTWLTITPGLSWKIESLVW